VLHKELDADDGELTRTRKVRRGFIAEKYQVLVDALYGGPTEQFIETAVKFEDGRTGSVSADCDRDAKTFRRGKAGSLNEDPRRSRFVRCPLRGGRRVPPQRTMPNDKKIGDVILDVKNISLSLRRREGADRHQLRRPRARDPRHHRPNGAGKSSMLNVHQRRLHAAAGRPSPSAARPSST
jgi:hypothetical protein